MTTFSELVALTVEQTRRPEVSQITNSAVRTAVLRAHHVDFFPRDLASQLVSYTVSPTAMYYDFPDISATLTSLRSIKSVDGITQDGFKIEQLEYRTPDDLYDGDGCPRRYVYTLQGDTLRAYFDMPTGITNIYYFRNPNVTEAQFSSWIADTYPDQMAQWAAMIVLNRLGFRELANSLYEDQIVPFREQLLASHLLGSVI